MVSFQSNFNTIQNTSTFILKTVLVWSLLTIEALVWVKEPHRFKKLGAMPKTLHNMWDKELAQMPKLEHMVNQLVEQFQYISPEKVS
jgi:hypothetical protein